MNKVNTLLNKYFIYAIWAFLLVSLTVNFRSCGVVKENRKVKEEIVILQSEVDSLESSIDKNIYDKEELNIRLEILGYEISKRMLYDNNLIIRKKTRPDDQMHKYDIKIKELTDKLK